MKNVVSLVIFLYNRKLPISYYTKTKLNYPCEIFCNAETYMYEKTVCNRTRGVRIQTAFSILLVS